MWRVWRTTAALPSPRALLRVALPGYASRVPRRAARCARRALEADVIRLCSASPVAVVGERVKRRGEGRRAMPAWSLHFRTRPFPLAHLTTGQRAA